MAARPYRLLDSSGYADSRSLKDAALHPVTLTLMLVVQLQDRLMQLKREKGEADGLVQILNAKLSEAEEDNFELRANMRTIEVEAAYEAKKTEEQLRKQMSSMESRLSFLADQLKNAERVKLRALREVEELQQRQLLEQKRLDAEKRLLATKKRKHESVMIAASQTLMTRMQQSSASSSQATTPPSSAPNTKNNVSTSAAAIQTEPLQDTHGYAQVCMYKAFEPQACIGFFYSD